MLKVLAWVVSNDGRYFKSAVNILERQHKGVDLVGVTANKEFSLQKDGKKIPFIPLAELKRFGGVTLSLLSEHGKLA